MYTYTWECIECIYRNTRLPCLPSEKHVFRTRSNSETLTWENGLVQNWERSVSRLYIVTLLIWLIHKVHHMKYWDGWLTSWNQDCWKKYWQPQICRWYRFNPWSRKWQSNPVFLPGEFHAQRNLVGYSLGVTESWTWLSNWAHHFNGRKWRWTKEPFDEGERKEWKSWL